MITIMSHWERRINLERFTPLRLVVSRIGLSNGIFRSYDSILRAGGKRRFTRWRARATARASLVD